jgi:hypothetical protein
MKYLFMVCLMLGFVDQVSDSIALVEYENSGQSKYIILSLDNSLCFPREGQRVIFDSSRIVLCIDN